MTTRYTIRQEQECGTCGGRGYVIALHCGVCGQHYSEEELSGIPAGISELPCGHRFFSLAGAEKCSECDGTGRAVYEAAFTPQVLSEVLHNMAEEGGIYEFARELWKEDSIA